MITPPLASASITFNLSPGPVTRGAPFQLAGQRPSARRFKSSGSIDIRSLCLPTSCDVATRIGLGLVNAWSNAGSHPE